MYEQKNDTHPWDDFLDARAKVILWLKNELKYTDARIAHELSMDEEQVRLIREWMEAKG